MPYSHFPTQRHNIEQRIVQKAWAEPEYRDRLLADPKAALSEALGVELPERLRVEVVEEQPDLLCIVVPVDTSGVPYPEAQVMMGVAPMAPLSASR
ncbi:MAG: NHLP leader peptide family RiPP precursor [Acidimicrobiaceae bacterium]|nr:NHLP leader peptide family RiPP precursor [Acidimicrobiaceae bacterium]